MKKQAVSNDYYFKVAFGETDAAGIVFFANYYVWMDRATHELFDVLGIDQVNLIMDEKVGLALIETHCRNFFPLRFYDHVRMRTTVEEVRTRGVKITHEYYRDEILIALGYEVRAWVDFNDKEIKSSPIPEIIRKKLLGEA